MDNKNILSEREQWFARYNEQVHREGRIWTLLCLGFLLCVPFLMGLVLGAMPDMNRFIRGFINVILPVWWNTSFMCRCWVPVRAI